MKFKTLAIVVSAAFIMFNTTICDAQHHQSNTSNNKSEHYDKHHIDIFNGFTNILKQHITSYSIGTTYEYRFSNLIGLGIIGEYITSKADEFLVGIPMAFHPYKGFRFLAAPLLVYSEEHHEKTSHDHEVHKTEKEAHLLGRLGISYAFHVNHFSIDPEINFDFGNTESLGYGIAIGYGI